MKKERAQTKKGMEPIFIRENIKKLRDENSNISTILQKVLIDDLEW